MEKRIPKSKQLQRAAIHYNITYYQISYHIDSEDGDDGLGVPASAHGPGERDAR